MTMLNQLAFDLQPRHPLSLKYLVPHSGIAEAVSALENAVERIVAEPCEFQMIYLFGPHGAGKSHLAYSYGEEALERGLPKGSLAVFEIETEQGPVDQEFWESRFIDVYDSLRTSGGLLIVAADDAPDRVTNSPHIGSRLLAGTVLELRFPGESELVPVVQSLLERRNLQLPQNSVQYLLRRLPRNPLSLGDIFDKISELSFRTSKPAKLGLVRQVVLEDQDDK